MIIFGILIAIVLVIVIIALVVYYWYITIPIIILAVLYSKRDKIKQWNEEQKKTKQFKSAYGDWSKKSQRKWNVCKELGLTENEAKLVFGDSWKEYVGTAQIFLYCLQICTEPNQIIVMPKHLIYKMSDILETMFTAFKYEAFHLGQINAPDTREFYDEKYGRAKETIKTCLENYAQYHNRTEQQNTRHQSYSTGSQYHYTGKGRYAQARERRINERFHKFGITAHDAELIFGKRWERILGKQEIEFFYDVWSIEIKLTYDNYGRYRKKLGSLYSKVLEIIRIVDEENPEQARHKGSQSRTYQTFDGSEDLWEEVFDESDADFEDQYTSTGYDETDSDDYVESGLDDQSKIQWAFTVLGLKEGTAPDDIKKRYKELTLQYHPDRNHSHDATRKMAEINNAYEVLMEGSQSAK